LSARFNRLREGLLASLNTPIPADAKVTLSLQPLLALSLDAYTTLSRHVISCLDELLESAERRLGLVSLHPEVGVDQPRLRVVGKPGDTLEAAFVIRNDLNAEATVRLHHKPLHSAVDALEKYRLSFTPASANLAPNAQHVIRLQADLACDLEPKTYLSRITIEGLPDRRGTLNSKHIWIELVVAA
jgi:hypothetical protein